MEAFCRNLNFESGIPVVNPTVYTNPLASPPISTPSSQVICFRVPNRHDCILIVLQIIVDSIFLQNIIHRIEGEVPKCFCQNHSKKFSNCPKHCTRSCSRSCTRSCSRNWLRNWPGNWPKSWPGNWPGYWHGNWRRDWPGNWPRNKPRTDLEIDPEIDPDLP